MEPQAASKKIVLRGSRQWGEIAAISYIRKHPNIVILAPMGDFSNIGSGRPFPYEILWTRDAHITPEALRAEIETQRPLHLQASLREREETIKRYPVIT
jgi:hypothetical protein